eukprot:7070102-Pyramimonas_sp.AAC.1
MGLRPEFRPRSQDNPATRAVASRAPESRAIACFCVSGPPCNARCPSVECDRHCLNGGAVYTGRLHTSIF